jgi:hypothetical protein
VDAASATPRRREVTIARDILASLFDERPGTNVRLRVDHHSTGVDGLGVEASALYVKAPEKYSVVFIVNLGGTLFGALVILSFHGRGIDLQNTGNH